MRLIDEDVWGIINTLAEARSEPYLGQVAIGNVVRDRMKLKYHSDGTVLGTVWWPSQFSWTLSTDKQRLTVLRADDSSSAVALATKAWYESATVRAVPPGTVLYHANYVSPSWRNAVTVKLVKQIGAHLFYTDGV